MGKRILQLSPFHHATWQHPRESPRHVRGSARIYDVRMAQFVPKIEKLSYIMGPRGSQDLRSPSLIMAPGEWKYVLNWHNVFKSVLRLFNLWPRLRAPDTISRSNAGSRSVRTIDKAGGRRAGSATNGIPGRKGKGRRPLLFLPRPRSSWQPLFPWPHPKRPSHGKLKLANSS